VTSPSSPPGRLRPFDLRRDLAQVADLVESCFAEHLDAEGREFVRRMRAASRGSSVFGWASAGAERISLPLNGFVWELNGELIGNLSLIPAYAHKRRAYLIANVAVQPSHRQQGIARALTGEALQYIRRKGVKDIYLQARHDNPAALHLYHSFGFSEQTRRTTWQCSQRLASLPPTPDQASVAPRRRDDWPQQQAWLAENYPSQVAWHLPLDLKLLQPGFWGALLRALGEDRLRQWAATQDDHLIGVLSAQSSPSPIVRLWLAAPPEHDEAAIEALLPRARATLPRGHTLTLNYPAGRANAALQAAGFQPHHTLIWMHKSLAAS